MKIYRAEGRVNKRKGPKGPEATNCLKMLMCPVKAEPASADEAINGCKQCVLVGCRPFSMLDDGFWARQLTSHCVTLNG